MNKSLDDFVDTMQSRFDPDGRVYTEKELLAMAVEQHVECPTGMFPTLAAFQEDRKKECDSPSLLESDGEPYIGWYTRLTPKLRGPAEQDPSEIVFLPPDPAITGFKTHRCGHNTAGLIWTEGKRGKPIFYSAYCPKRDRVIDFCNVKTNFIEKAYHSLDGRQLRNDPICVHCIRRAIEQGRLIQYPTKTAPE